MQPILLRPNRKGAYLSLAFALAMTMLGVALILAGTAVTGIAALVLAAVGIAGAIGGLLPGLGLRLDARGFHLKAIGKSWGAQWLEIESFAATRVRLGRQDDVDVVEIRYQPGVGTPHLPPNRLGETLGIDERYLMAGYGGLTGAQLAELLERYRSAGAPAASAQPEALDK
jgi:hypothetical protein